ncbi:Protein kinase domain [Arabidopsis thaliana x Arabidopsis arenosa]|uniref:RING-type E3 ubiquitin transferase n=1 Tax=Arabidopsis thaliana x Arabidopsis arenosa TaxID=1240361 RepID=A0A8T2A4G8_9BRAS|nr:Protein kinase domain [Arabidopsis thaliana x Arabidopsis arenosa]
MWMPKNNNVGVKEGGSSGIVAVAIDKDKSSQHALKWAVDHLLQRGQSVILVHVKLRPSPLNNSPSLHASSAKLSQDSSLVCRDPEGISKELFLPFRCFCTRKDIQCQDVLLEESDVAKALVEYVNQAAIEVLVVGSSSKGGFLRFNKPTDIPGNITKNAPDFCTVYIISKGKIQTMRSASRSAPMTAPLRSPVQPPSLKPPQPMPSTSANSMRAERRSFESNQRRSVEDQQRRSMEDQQRRSMEDQSESFRSPFTRRGNGKSYGDLSVPESDISFISSGRPSIDRIFPSLYDNNDPNRTPPRLSNFSDMDNSSILDQSSNYGRRSVDMNSPTDYSTGSFESERFSSASQSIDDVEAEMRRLKLELKQTMEMYSTACKEALTAKQKATELQRWKLEEERKLEEARHAEEAALAIAEKEKAKSKAAMEAAEAAQRIAELEAKKRVNAEMKALKESEEKTKALTALANSDVRYRKYSIEEIELATEFFAEKYKIGEGGYGPVYKCYLDHTPVAVKVLRPDAAQGRSQFQQEVEVLSCIRHPNMVLLLGACPECGCLVYEFMANGSLEDRLFRLGNSPPLSWQMRFRIAAEIGTGLLFLHQAKPEPLVHRDLKPGNILLDRNFVSKISDVGLARLVPPSVADTVTQYRMTSTAGTFCYIDPEYQQTGMLGVKSDIYSLGIMFLQLITAKPPMGLTHYVERALEKGTLADLLDPAVSDWPMEDTEEFAKLALKCAELRRKDRPDLAKVILPELNRLRTLADESSHSIVSNSHVPSPTVSQSSLKLEHMSGASISVPQ